jgi:hypothetical protein
MKLNKTILAILLSTVVGKSDIITLQFKPSGPVLLKKYVTIPAGKVCKIITMSSGISFGNVDTAGGEVQIFEGNFIITSQNVVTVSGPAKIFFKKETGNGGLITLDIVDQNSPKSGVTITDN